MKRLALVSLLLLACQPPAGATDGGTTAAPTFALVDVNPNSTTTGQSLGPTSFAGKVTGWYFGHSS